MSLYQPTNIIPSLIGSFGNGVVDASDTNGMTVSWQVNGNSAMTAFEIKILSQNAASTVLYDTGKITSGCPFYGTDFAGRIQFFSYTISAAALSTASITNGNEYKLLITQWWSNADSITQSSASAFRTRAKPTLTISNLPEPLTARSYKFNASYSQANGDSINWVRWQIADVDKVDEPFFDTQNIYGTGELSAEYDGFFTDNTYAVRCTVQTESGVIADTDWNIFSCEYVVKPLEGLVSVCQTCTGVKLAWDNINYIVGRPVGSYRITGEHLFLDENSSVTWDNANGVPLSLSAPWAFAWKGKLGAVPSIGTVNAFTFTMGQWDMAVKVGSSGVTLSYHGTTLGSFTASQLASKTFLTEEDIFTFIITPTTFYARCETPSGGLYPANNLYPSNSLYPADNTSFASHNTQTSISYTQGTIGKVVLSGEQETYYVWVGGAEETAVFTSMMTGNTSYKPDDIASSVFYASFANGLNAGSTFIASDDYRGMLLYRKDEDDDNFHFVGYAPIGTFGMMDYGARSQVKAKWYAFPFGENSIIAYPLESPEYAPVFWNWTIYECEENMDSDYSTNSDTLTPVEIFSFSCNVSSSTISNENSPGILQNFTRYPTVQLAPQNYQAGTIEALIGNISSYHYSDTVEKRNAIWALSKTKNRLFLKNRKGDFLEIRISGSITMKTLDESKEQAQTVTLPWVEIKDTKMVSVAKRI